MYGTFNMGVGMVVVIEEENVEKALNLLGNAYEIGEITENSEKIILM
jgi:phosphoribosylformylglycinamidine cyclo-ligase